MINRKALASAYGLAFAFALGSAGAEPTVVGWIEPVKLGAEGVIVPAKLDTGADVSSLHVSQVTWLKRPDGEPAATVCGVVTGGLGAVPCAEAGGACQDAVDEHP